MDYIFWATNWWMWILWLACYLSIGSGFMAAGAWLRGSMIADELVASTDPYDGGTHRFSLSNNNSSNARDAVAIISGFMVPLWPAGLAVFCGLLVIGVPIYLINELYEHTLATSESAAKKQLQSKLHDQLLELEKKDTPNKEERQKMAFLRTELGIPAVPPKP